MDEKHVKVLLDFYYEIISAKEFVNYLNCQPDLQQKFNTVLKNSVPSGSTPTEWLNLICNKIGTPEDSPVKSADGERHVYSDSSQSFMILLFVKEFIAKSDAVCYLPQEEINDIIISAVTDNAVFYNATRQVETYILTKIIANMPAVKTLNSAVRYVKTQMKVHFKCDNKMPGWLQSCEWAFNENGEPMIFKCESGNARHKIYTFYDSETLKEAVVEQFN